MQKLILNANNITKSYNKHSILRGLNMNISKGSIYGLIGKNGAGKTTLLRIIAGLIPSYGGEIIIDKANNISAIIDSPSLFLNMSAYENMKQQAILQGVMDYTIIETLLKTVGLEETQRKKTSDFSLGMTQRLKLAMSLISSPKFLILDEPLNGLDPDGISDLRILLTKLSQNDGVSILISSHILTELEQVATHFGILHEGKIAKEFNSQELSDNNITLEKIYMKITKGDIN